MRVNYFGESHLPQCFEKSIAISKREFGCVLEESYITYAASQDSPKRVT